ncbi:PEP-CTERM sorting domain-containing protein [Bythopirellula polymerisocia]|uniref:PEP-CTERM protein-sorting domain-containing protein n=1 Tax=Bythopirellula polymerisocia TaxID=2528003 RepID=A0A5C6CUJ8_9BACT|nr:PEP-CTERM sorting domain-containing protein [Bythopirellula polymerisocia]TWU28250.1 hypothetical protein Pla144_15370 [Bythopirellula polymerisocia]
MRSRILNTLSLLGCIFAVAVCGSVACATTVSTDDFNYPDGPLRGQGTPPWENHSGTNDTLLVSSGAAVVSEDSGSEDLHKLFDAGASFAGGVVTASFDIVVTAPSPITSNSSDEYFAHFWQSANPNNFRARTFVHAPTAGGDYTLSISTLSSSVSTDLPTDFSFGATVPVSISFDITAGTSSLTAGGNTVYDLTSSTGQIIDAFALRQSNSGSDETIRVDNLVVTHVPEPTSIAMLLGCLGMLTIRRR